MQELLSWLWLSDTLIHDITHESFCFFFFFFKVPPGEQIYLWKQLDVFLDFLDKWISTEAKIIQLHLNDATLSGSLTFLKY